MKAYIQEKSKFLSQCFNQISAVSYVPESGAQIPDLWLPHIPQLVTMVRTLVVMLILFLTWPLTRLQKDPKLEKERKLIITLSAVAGILALGIRFYRHLAGI